jgi:hypothetical protein
MPFAMFSMNAVMLSGGPGARHGVIVTQRLQQRHACVVVHDASCDWGPGITKSQAAAWHLEIAWP